ncbi:MAG: aminopeptidase N [Burkholderiaceae bacterium]
MNATVTIRREDYQPPSCFVDAVDLRFVLAPDDTRVYARLQMRRRPQAPGAEFTLNGQALELVDLRIDGRPVAHAGFVNEQLTLTAPAEHFVLESQVIIKPAENSTLNGLYMSQGNYFTQCEAEGFRRICPFPDRPDVMARYRVRIEAPRAAAPVLLSNGNLLESGDLPGKDGLHYAVWEDPFPKPSYLFALVAGDLVCTERLHRSADGQDKLLQVWVEPGNEDKTEHAMTSLVNAIEWDERRYGLALDLDRFMIVAVSDFNMGAMENKGLNIFNTKYVFANPLIATDADFSNVESVVGHEYFHNWTGNRVTCRDWFQLTLKEGLTVFRDQQFSADMHAAQADTPEHAASARAVKRIEDVRLLRTMQFAEDAGPMAHPIRPDSYTEINNFYTVTVYEKGAEVIRMLHTLLGDAGFRRGMDLYFERHDGQAVTCDDFVAAMADANGRDLKQFSRWYEQAGTPIVRVQRQWHAEAGELTLSVTQLTPPTPGQNDKPPLLIPLAVALLDDDGREMPVRLAGEPESAAVTGTRVLALTEAAQTLRFTGLASCPTPSLLRGFSAPVQLEQAIDEDELARLARVDGDAFNRWEAGQRLAVGAVLAVLRGADPQARTARLIEALAHGMRDERLDPAYRSLLLTLPTEGYIAEQIDPLDPQALRSARAAVRQTLHNALAGEFTAALGALAATGPYRPDTGAAGRRALRNLALGALVDIGREDAWRLADEQLRTADNMTDRAAAIGALVNSAAPQREAALEWFCNTYAHEPLALDKWFTMQATMIRQPGDAPVLERVRALTRHPEFSLRNPNRARSLIGAFCSANLAEFHAPDGSGYAFWLEQVRAIDELNPQLAARLARALDRWRKFEPRRRDRMRATLTELAGTKGLSRDVGEIVAKALNGA